MHISYAPLYFVRDFVWKMLLSHVESSSLVFQFLFIYLLTVILAGAFLNFFNNVHDRRADTELIQQGIKPRRQDPLPAVPSVVTTDEKSDNSFDEGNYAVIGDAPPTSPYVEVAIRASFFQGESDSLPSSPDQLPLSRSSTLDSHEAETAAPIQHDESGLYATVNKKQNQFTYIKKVEKPSSDDDDDDISWEDNVAYDTSINITPEQVTQSPKRISDSPYATVPLLPKEQRHKPVTLGYDKNATLPTKFPKTSDWNEPTYASIDQIKTEVSTHTNHGYEPDSNSSVSTRSKESQGSLLELADSQNKKTPESATTWYVQDDKSWHQSNSQSKSAPIATPEVCTSSFTYIFFSDFLIVNVVVDKGLYSH